MYSIPSVDVEPPSVEGNGSDLLDTVINFITNNPAVIVIGVLTILIAGFLKKPFVKGGIVIGGIAVLVVYVLMSNGGGGS
jgi:hypothetical protein